MHQDSVERSTGQAPRAGGMLVVSLAWGGCFVAIRLGLADAPPLWFAAWRALLAGAVLLAMAKVSRRPSPPQRSRPTVVLLGIFNVGIAFAAMFEAGPGLSSGVASVLANSQPILLILPTWALYRERPSSRVLLTLAAGFAGLVITATSSGGDSGTLLALAAAAAITVGTLISRRLGGLDVVALSAYQFIVGGLILAGWAAILEGVPTASWTPRFVVILLLLAAGGTALPYLLWFAELQRAPLASVAAWTLTAPGFGLALGWLLLAEALSANQMIGIGLVFAALAGLTLPTRVRPMATAGPARRRPSILKEH